MQPGWTLQSVRTKLPEYGAVLQPRRHPPVVRVPAMIRFNYRRRPILDNDLLMQEVLFDQDLL